MAPEQRHSEHQRDREAILLELLTRERRVLFQQAQRHSRDDADAEDALSDAIVQFLRHYNGPRGKDAARWMMVVIRNCARQTTRRAGRWQARERVQATDDVDDAGAIIPSDPGPGPAESIVRAEETAAIVQAIDALRPDERRALLLRGLGYSYKEIEHIQGWSRTKVRRCISEGRAAVRIFIERGGNS